MFCHPTDVVDIWLTLSLAKCDIEFGPLEQVHVADIGARNGLPCGGPIPNNRCAQCPYIPVPFPVHVGNIDSDMIHGDDRRMPRSARAKGSRRKTHAYSRGRTP